MRIQCCNNINFESKANPIAPYVFRTKCGGLSVSEATIKNFKRRNFVRNLSHFFCRNFASMTNDPGWKKYKGKSAIRDDAVFRDFYEYMRSRLLKKDDSMTLLIARDQNKKIKGACLAYKCDIIPGTNNNVCYIDSLAVEKDCRGNGLARNMIEKIAEAEKGRFTDIFLTGDRMADGFYKKLGFGTMNAEDKNQKAVMDYMETQRTDYPAYVELFTRPLQEDKPRWYEYIKLINFI